MLVKQMEFAVSLIMLGILAKYDLKWKKIPQVWMLLFTGIAFLFAYINRTSIYEMIVSMIPGMILLTISLLTHEAIGYGDGAVALVLGLMLGVDLCVFSVLLGFLLIAPYALYRMWKRNKEPIPLIPFLLLGMEVIVFAI